jgi:hypothetical protein
MSQKGKLNAIFVDNLCIFGISSVGATEIRTGWLVTENRSNASDGLDEVFRYRRCSRYLLRQNRYLRQQYNVRKHNNVVARRFSSIYARLPGSIFGRLVRDRS